jgi:signal transduction histidine kinase
LLTLDAKMAAKKTVIYHEPNPELPAVPVEKDRMIQVLTNLFGNAIAYTPNQGEIAISSEITEGENGRFASLTIHNNGPPISESDLPHIFERFYRGQNAHYSDEHGTGLGLAISKEIIERHQGRIEVASTREDGTTFRLHLPL